MGLGMGGTMMPIMTSALQSLQDHEIARGSTLMNITQQVAASIGTALFSVLLTNSFNASAAVGQLRAAQQAGQVLRDPAIIATALKDMADGFGGAFVVATVLIALCLVPAYLLPRQKTSRAVENDAAAVPTLMH
jgi:hypothetical protein